MRRRAGTLRQQHTSCCTTPAPWRRRQPCVQSTPAVQAPDPASSCAAASGRHLPCASPPPGHLYALSSPHISRQNRYSCAAVSMSRRCSERKSTCRQAGPGRDHGWAAPHPQVQLPASRPQAVLAPRQGPPLSHPKRLPAAPHLERPSRMRLPLQSPCSSAVQL